MKNKAKNNGQLQDVNDIPTIANVIKFEAFFRNYKTLEKGKWVKVEGWAKPKRRRKKPSSKGVRSVQRTVE